MNSPTSKHSRLEIKKILFNENDFLRTVPLIILIFLGYGRVPNHFLLILLILVLVFMIISLRRVVDRSTQFIFDKTGIYDIKKQNHYSWDFINEIEFYIGENDYLKLIFKYKNSRVVLNFNNLSISPKKIEEYIKIIDVNKLRDKDKELKSEVANILKGNENSEKIIKIFKKYKTKTSWLMGISFFGTLALAIFLQVKFTFPYSFAIGWVLLLTILSVINTVAEKRFYNSEFARNITENQFNDLMIRFDLRLKNHKRKKIVGYVTIAIVTIVVFVASFHLSK